MTVDTSADWVTRSRRAAFASHRLVGWIYWDPPAIAACAALGVPDWMPAARERRSPSHG